MRLAFGISLILLGLFWLAATFDLRQPAQTEAAHWKDAPVGSKWRRTAGGWQRVEQVLPQTERATPTTLHPATVAAFQLLASVLALSMLPAGTSKRSTEPTSHSAEPKVASKPHHTRKSSRGVTC
jgi:hypothetical protein